MKMSNQVSSLFSCFFLTLVHLSHVSWSFVSLQLLSTLSFTDLFGSLAYALTTLPTPTDDYLYGSQGNDNTCVAQGFFIQVGTIACFLNVSLAVYYHLTIANNWTDAKIRRTYLAHVLFIVPIIIGLAFAFAGIPYYDNVVVWCNNSAKWAHISVFCLNGYVECTYRLILW